MVAARPRLPPRALSLQIGPVESNGSCGAVSAVGLLVLLANWQLALVSSAISRLSLVNEPRGSSSSVCVVLCDSPPGVMLLAAERALRGAEVEGSNVACLGRGGVAACVCVYVCVCVCACVRVCVRACVCV